MSGKYLRKVIGVGLAITSFLCTLGLPSFSQVLPENSPTHHPPALELARIGQQQYQRQQFSDAALSWEQAAKAYQAGGDEEGAQKSRINQSQALQNLGLYPKACRTLLQALNTDKPDCQADNISSLVSDLSSHDDSLSAVQGIGLRSLGDVLRRQGLFISSKQVLELSLAKTETSSKNSSTQLSLGNTERSISRQVRNRWDYEQVTDIINRQSATIAIQTAQPAFSAYQQATVDAPLSTQVQAQLNQLSLWIDLQGWWDQKTQQRIESWQRLDQDRFLQRAENFSTQLHAEVSAQTHILQNTLDAGLAQLPPSRSTVFAQLNFARSLIRLKNLNGNEESLLRNAIDDRIRNTLTTALNHSQAIGDKRSEAYTLGYLGQFYGELGQSMSAIQFTQQALTLTNQEQRSDASDGRYLWQAQLGRLFDEQGDRTKALNAYMDAYRSLQALRSDLSTNNPDIQFDFQQDVKPIYLALADLLLQSESSEKLATLANIQSDVYPLLSSRGNDLNRLEMARQVIESLQLAELDNFFQDPCSDVPDIPVQIDDIDPRAAVIYPIVFRDRLDLLLSMPDQPLRQISVPVSQDNVNQTLDELYDLLNNESIDTSAINIFRTVPINSQEVATNLQQLLPIFAQVYDWLVRPLEADLRGAQVDTLVFVLNDRLQRVPLAALYDGQQYLIEKYGVALAPSLQLINSEIPTQKRPRILVAGVSQQTKVGDSNFPALVNVPDELNRIQAIFPRSKKLLDRDFTEQRLRQSLSRNYSIIHLATHGLFSSNPEKNFIVTGDQQSISIKDLSEILREQGAKAPQLLVLSACETATGDEQAVLGLAGVAVRSGTSSTLATLWPVSDASTTKFMGQFYQALSQPDRQKNEALRTAQQNLLSSLKSNPPFEELKGVPPHPYYWAPYVLVGSWR